MSPPDSLNIRTYQVGFGDCFLLSFHYPKTGAQAEKTRHVLIDFGSTGKPDDVAADLMMLVAKDIAATVSQDGHELTAVVATHRHKDHISGFATKAGGKGTGDIIAALRPKLVLQPWTEDPEAEKEALKPTTNLATTTTDTALAGAAAAEAAGRPQTNALGLGLRSMRHVASLAHMQGFSANLLREMRTLGLGVKSQLRRELHFIGDDNLANVSAVQNLMTMSPTKEFLSYGRTTRLAQELGLKIHVLGPPTLEDTASIRKQRAADRDEFWHLMGLSAKSFNSAVALPFDAKHVRARKASAPSWARWLIPKMDRNRAHQLLELVRVLDDQMNNTSLILLFEVGGKLILFPGDAQIENWNYALKEAPEAKANRDLLKKVDFYKVGHHGSLNATPKTLWGLFAKRGAAGKKDRLRTAVSTMFGKHGNPRSGTEVPRRPLVAALEAESDFLTTEKYKPTTLYTDIGIPFTAAAAAAMAAAAAEGTGAGAGAGAAKKAAAKKVAAKKVAAKKVAAKKVAAKKAVAKKVVAKKAAAKKAVADT